MGWIPQLVMNLMLVTMNNLLQIRCSLVRIYRESLDFVKVPLIWIYISNKNVPYLEIDLAVNLTEHCFTDNRCLNVCIMNATNEEKMYFRGSVSKSAFLLDRHFFADQSESKFLCLPLNPAKMSLRKSINSF